MNKKMKGQFIRFNSIDEIPITIAEIDSENFLNDTFNENILNMVGLEALKIVKPLYEPSETIVVFVGSVLKEDLEKIQYTQLTMGESEEYIDSPYDETYLIVQDEDIDFIRNYFVKGIEEKRAMDGKELKYIPLYKKVVNKYQAWWYDYESINKCILKYKNDKEAVGLLNNLSIINNVLFFYNKLDSTREYKEQKTYLLIVNK